MLCSSASFSILNACIAGLVGSNYYVSNLNATERARIALALNFDMLGSPNFFRATFNASSGPANVQNASTIIQHVFEGMHAIVCVCMYASVLVCVELLMCLCVRVRDSPVINFVPAAYLRTHSTHAFFPYFFLFCIVCKCGAKCV